jgi:hypothetical protein
MIGDVDGYILVYNIEQMLYNISDSLPVPSREIGDMIVTRSLHAGCGFATSNVNLGHPQD